MLDNPWRGPKTPSASALGFVQRICLLDMPTTLHRNSTTRRLLRSRVPPQGQTRTLWYRNVDLFSIAYALRPRLRVRLTRSG
jgi:hypothetical protein